MSLHTVVRLAASLWLCVSSSAVLADDLKDWILLPAKSAGIVLVIDAKVEHFAINTPDKKFFDQGKWDGGPLVRQIRVPPGKYELLLPEPAESLSVNAREGLLTYVRLAPYRLTGETVGVRIITWTGPLPGDVAGLLAGAFSKGIPYAYKTPFADVPAKTFFVSTEPPWAPPPPPRK